MRTIRTLTIAAAVIATLPIVAAAQQGRDFKDAWFWGVKFGGLTVADSAQRYKQAPVVGGDWMITRTHGGVYMAASEAFFNQHTFILQDPSVGDSVTSVQLKNLRRFDMALMGFPGEYYKWHPYIGAGFTLAEVASTHVEGTFNSLDRLTVVEAEIQNERVSFSPLFMAGGQYRLNYFSVFGQLTLSPAQRNFILFNGRPWHFGYEIGLRYNIGSSIDRD
jgi:hypothetical protein